MTTDSDQKKDEMYNFETLKNFFKLQQVNRKCLETVNFLPRADTQVASRPKKSEYGTDVIHMCLRL